MALQWLRLTTGGRVEVLADRKLTLEQMQAAVGGYVERLELGHGCELWLNEDGVGLALPVNRLAGEVMCHVMGRPSAALVVLVGDALLKVTWTPRPRPVQS